MLRWLEILNARRIQRQLERETQPVVVTARLVGAPASDYADPMRVLVLEDDAVIRAALVAGLRDQGYAVDEAERSTEAEGLAESYTYDAMVVDVRLPDGESAGFEFVRTLRLTGATVPVLFLTARDGVADRIAGLDAGADDYLIKPFDVGEVHARLRALVRRARPNLAPAFERDGLRIEWAARTVSLRGAPVHLTAREFAVLELLAAHPGRYFTRDEIVDRVWDAAYDTDAGLVDTYVKTIRRKLGEGVIETLRGVGYRFPPAHDESGAS